MEIVDLGEPRKRESIYKNKLLQMVDADPKKTILQFLERFSIIKNRKVNHLS